MRRACPKSDISCQPSKKRSDSESELQGEFYRKMWSFPAVCHGATSSLPCDEASGVATPLSEHRSEG
eukprot:363736-Chlamydomonas_euryale.AAC.9